MNNTVSDVTTIIRGLINDQQVNDGRDEFTYLISSNDNTFILSEDFVNASTIVVRQNNEIVAIQDWSYNASTNRVTIVFVSSGQALNTNDTILITYSYYGKYSDTEISGYLKSSLAYFAQYKYKKIFDINADDEIISVNDLEPEIGELYFIGIISAILIDPKNVEVRTSDFILKPSNDISGTEQIANAFLQFKKFVGTFELTRRIDRSC